MFETIGSFFGSLASKAKAKIIESTLQPLIDYHLENIFDQKIQISSLNKGISNVSLNVKHLNQMLKTNILREITIKTMKLEKLQLFMRDICIVIDLTIPSEMDSILRCIEIEDILQQSIHTQMQDLKKEFLAVPLERKKSNEPQTDMKTSSMTVFLLRMTDSLFGNLKVDIQNLQLKVIGTRLKSEANLLINVNSIKTQMQKLPNTEQIYLNGRIDTIQVFLNNNEQIAEISDALKLEIFLTGDQEPKISTRLSQMQFIATLKQIEVIKQILNQGSKMLDERQAVINEAFKSTKNKNLIEPVIYPKVQLNQFKISSYFSKNDQQLQHIIEDYEESQIIFEYNIASPQVKEFLQTTRKIQEQKEFLNIKIAGLHIYIPNINQPINFKNISKNTIFIKEFENYYSLIFSELQIIKNQQTLTYSIQSIYFYQFIELSEKFHSLQEQQILQSQDFECLTKKSLICRTIFKAGTQLNGLQSLQDSTSIIVIEEPKDLQAKNNNLLAIQIVQNGLNFQFQIPKFSIVLNKEQTAFFWKFAQIIGQSNQTKNNTTVELPQTKITFSINKTDFQIFYYQAKEITLETSYDFGQLHQFQLIEIKSFFLQTPNEKDRFQTKFEFEIAEICYEQNKIIAKNIKSEFGIQKPLKNSIQVGYNKEKDTIDRYRKRCQECLNNQLTIQIEDINIIHKDFGQFYQMIQDMNVVFNPPNQPKSQQNFYFAVKINKIEVQLYSTLLLNFYKFKYYFVIDYQFIQIFDANGFYFNKTSLLLMNQNSSSQIFTMRMTGDIIDLEVSPIKVNLTNFDFLEASQCIENLLSDLKYLNQQESIQQPKNEKLINFKINQLMFDLLPTYNEEVILQKKNLTKLKYNQQECPSWTRSIIVCNQFQFSKGSIKAEDISLYFTSTNENQSNDNLIQIDDYFKVATVHTIQFENKTLSIDAIQFFQFSKQLFIDLVDHFEHINKDKKKNNTKDIQQAKKYQKIESIAFPEPQFKIECHQISLSTQKNNLDIFIYQVAFSMSVQSCQLRIGRLQILDNIKKSKFQYLLDQEDLQEIEDIQSDILQQSPFLDCILLFDQQSLAMKLKIKPIRICLSGYQLKELLDSFNSQARIAKQLNQFDENDNDLLELIHQQKSFNLQVELEPLLVIVSYDSDGLEVDNIKAQFLKFGSFNNLILSTNKKIDFYQNSPTSKQEFIQYLMNQHLSTFGIIFQAYNSLEITKVASSFTNGIVNMFSKPFISSNGFFYGLIEGTYDFTCGVTSSLLSLTSMPANAINNVASFIGLGKISAPLQQLDEFCKKLYFKINPEQGIPERFFKNST